MASETELIAKVHEAIKPGFLLINIGEYWTPTDSALVVAGGGAHLERTNFPLTDRLPARWTQIDNLLALNVYTEFVTLWTYTDWVTSKSFPSFQGGMYSSRLERGQIVQLASYYMAVPADPTRLTLDQQNMWNVRPDTVWVPAVEADVGHPREARHSVATGTDAAGQKYRIYARDFDRAHAQIPLRELAGPLGILPEAPQLIAGDDFVKPFGMHEQHWTRRRASHLVGNAAEHSAGQHRADVGAKHDQAHVMDERFLDDRGRRRTRPQDAFGLDPRATKSSTDGIEIGPSDGFAG
jgi:hypothetical protein